MSDTPAPPLSWSRGSADQRRAWKRYWIDDVISGVREMALHFLMRLMTTDACSNAGARLGPLVGPLDTKSDARLRRNLALLRPGSTETEIETARLANWRNVGRTMSEFSVLERLWRSKRVTIHGFEHIEAARTAGAPRIYAAVHLANWELFGPKLLELGEDGMEFYQPPRNRFQRWLAERTRRRFGDRLLPPGPNSVVKALRGLKGGRGLVFFIDDFTNGRVNGPALGRELSSHVGLAAAVRLARSTGAVLLPGYVLRQAGARFQMHILPPVDLAHLTLEEGMRQANAVLEPVVRANLEQWYMLHELRDLPDA